MPAIEELAVFLQNNFLFDRLSEEEIQRLAAVAQVQELQRGEMLYKQGTPSTELCLVLSGRVRLISSDGKSNFTLGSLTWGDVFGEDCFISPRRLDTAVALEATRVVKIPRSILNPAMQRDPALAALLLGIARSRQEVRRRRFRWFQESEIVYFLTRKHPFFFLAAEIVPFLLFILALALIAPTIRTGLPILSALTGLFVLGGLGGAIWLYLDWENDFYLVTSQRLLWIEKTILIYDSRQEALLVNILSTNRTAQPILARFINYANVFVRTYTGTISLTRAWRPDVLIELLEGLKTRALDISRQVSYQARENALRRRLGLPPREEELGGQPSSTSTRGQGKKTWWSSFINFFKMQVEEGTTITYRKHWFILLKKIWHVSLILLAVLIVAPYSWIKLGFAGLLACSLWFLIFIVAFGFWLYQVVDWHNDIFVLTPDSVIDIEKKPLTREEKRVASLDNILSVEHTRKGFIALLLNFGTVVMNIGTEKFTFDMVYQPVQVQYAITDRILSRRRRKQEEEEARRREEMAEWFAMYHRQLPDLEHPENPSA